MGSRTTARATATRCFSPSEICARLPVEHTLQMQKVGHLGDPGVGSRRAQPFAVQREHDVLAHGESGVEGVELEHHRDVALLRLEVVHASASDDDVTAACPFKAGDDPQCRRLAATRGPKQTHDLAGGHRQIDVTHGRKAAESLGDLPELNRRHPCSRSTFDGAEGDTAQKLILQREGHDDDGDEEQRLDGRQKSPAHADVAADGLRHGHGHGARLDA